MTYSISSTENGYMVVIKDNNRSVHIPVSNITPESMHRVLVEHGDKIDVMFGAQGLKCLLNMHYHTVNLFDRCAA